MCGVNIGFLRDKWFWLGYNMAYSAFKAINLGVRLAPYPAAPWYNAYYNALTSCMAYRFWKAKGHRKANHNKGRREEKDQIVDIIQMGIF